MEIWSCRLTDNHRLLTGWNNHYLRIISIMVPHNFPHPNRIGNNIVLVFLKTILLPVWTPILVLKIVSVQICLDLTRTRVDCFLKPRSGVGEVGLLTLASKNCWLVRTELELGVIFKSQIKTRTTIRFHFYRTRPGSIPMWNHNQNWDIDVFEK
jgi:hypothetical protein